MLKECVKGLADACAFFDVPVVGGNVSLYNEHGNGAIDPTPVVSMVGLIDTQEQVTRSQIEEPGLAIVLLGGLPNELGGSYYLQTQFNKKEGKVPEVNLENEKNLQDLLLSQIEQGRIRAAHDLAEGGLLVGLSEMLFSGTNLGAKISISSNENAIRLDALLFGESQGRVLVAVSSADLDDLRKTSDLAAVSYHLLGKSDETGKIELEVDEQKISSLDVGDLKSVWANAIPNHMEPTKN